MNKICSDAVEQKWNQQETLVLGKRLLLLSARSAVLD